MSPSKVIFLLETLPKTRTNYFWNPCRRSSARSESRSRSCHFIKKLPHELPWAGRVHFWWSRQFFHTMCGKLSPKSQHDDWNLFFLAKKNSQKIWWDTLNAVLTSLPKFPPDVHNPSRNFHCSKNIVPLIAKPWVGGIQLWRTSKIFPRNPEFYRQKYQNDKFFTPTGQIVFAYSPNVMTKSYFFSQKFFSPNILLDILNSCLESLPRKKLQNCKQFTLLIQKKLWEIYSSIK